MIAFNENDSRLQLSVLPHVSLLLLSLILSLEYGFHTESAYPAPLHETTRKMTVSIRRYTELKLAISDYLQRRNWIRLFELCGISDDETAKTIAVILTFYDPQKVWRFLDYISRMSPEERKAKRDSVATACYVIGRIGQTKSEKALTYLRRFLLDDHMLRQPVMSALSNLWVLDTKRTAQIVMRRWVLDTEDNDDLQEVGIKSSQYLASNAPERVSSFLQTVASLAEKRRTASRAAEEVIAANEIEGKDRKPKVAPKLRRKSNKKY